MPVDHGVKQLWRHRRAGQRGDRLRHDVGLLGGDAAVLDGEVGRVAGRVDVLHTGHSPVGVDTDEAVLAQRDAAHRGAVQLGQRDHPVDPQTAIAGGDHHLPRARHLHVRGVDRLDVRVPEQLGDGVARRGAEDRQRTVLWRDDRRRELDAHVGCAPGGHQRELIQRQRPGHAVRRHEREAVDVAALDVLDQAVQGLVHVAIVDRDRVLVTRMRVGAEREHQRVVLDPLAGLGLNRFLLRVDPVQLVGQQLRARVACDPLQGVAAAVPSANGSRTVIGR